MTVWKPGFQGIETRISGGRGRDILSGPLALEPATGTPVHAVGGWCLALLPFHSPLQTAGGWLLQDVVASDAAAITACRARSRCLTCRALRKVKNF